MYGRGVHNNNPWTVRGDPVRKNKQATKICLASHTYMKLMLPSKITRGKIHQFSAEPRLSRLFKITTGVMFSGSCNSPIQSEKRDLSRVFRSESCFLIILTRVKI